jgi:hypothetical protein
MSSKAALGALEQDVFAFGATGMQITGHIHHEWAQHLGMTEVLVEDRVIGPGGP